MKKPILNEVFTDNGEHSHWNLIDGETNDIIWSEDPIEDNINHNKLDLYTLKQIKFACNLSSDMSSNTLGYRWICEKIEELENNDINDKDNINNNNLLSMLSNQLNKWINDCETQAEIFKNSKMDTAELTSEAMEQAYWNIKQFIDVNKQ